MSIQDQINSKRDLDIIYESLRKKFKVSMTVERPFITVDFIKLDQILYFSIKE